MLHVQKTMAGPNVDVVAPSRVAGVLTTTTSTTTNTGEPAPVRAVA